MYMCSSQEQWICGTTYRLGWKGKVLGGMQELQGRGGWSRGDMEEQDDFSKVQLPYMHAHAW